MSLEEFKHYFDDEDNDNIFYALCPCGKKIARYCDWGCTPFFDVSIYIDKPKNELLVGRVDHIEHEPCQCLACYIKRTRKNAIFHSILDNCSTKIAKNIRPRKDTTDEVYFYYNLVMNELKKNRYNYRGFGSTYITRLIRDLKDLSYDQIQNINKKYAEFKKMKKVNIPDEEKIVNNCISS